MDIWLQFSDSCGNFKYQKQEKPSSFITCGFICMSCDTSGGAFISTGLC